MLLSEAISPKDYIIESVNTGDDELDAFLFSLDATQVKLSLCYRSDIVDAL